MYLQVKIPENGTKNVFRNKHTTGKVPLIILEVKALTER